MEPLNIYEREARIKRIKTLISACRLRANRADIFALWGVGSPEELNDAQLLECGQFMEVAYRGKTTVPSGSVRRLRSLAMTLINRAGKYATPDDWSEVNRFLLQRKVCGRLLYMLAEPELEALIRKLRAIADKAKAPEPKSKETVIALWNPGGGTIVN